LDFGVNDIGLWCQKPIPRTCQRVVRIVKKY
jgi:hypothetical protein